MVIRREKHSRKRLGARRWGHGNIKNARGAGGRGGVGKGGKKHKFTYYTAKHPELIRKKGFTPWKKSRLKEVSLREVALMALSSNEPMPKILLKSSKVLGNGAIPKPVSVTATKFSKSAMEKIKASGGEAILIKDEQ